MKAHWWKVRGIALLLLGALWPSCSNDEQAPAGGAGAAGTGGASGSGGSSGGSAGAPEAGAGGSLSAMAGSAGSASGGNSGAGGNGSTGASSPDPTCDPACEHAVACLTNGTLCAGLSAQDAGAIATACHEICAVLRADFEALAEHADRCGLALSTVVDNADLSQRPNRDVLERCAPSEACRGVCDTVADCAANHCENLGAVGSAIFSACMNPCAGDETWITSVNAAQSAMGCSASLDVFEAAQPGQLPAGCAEQN